MTIKLNADLGEGMGNDESIMPFLTYANIACGGHVGDDDSIRKAVEQANKKGVKVGAHPSYPDKVNFGRKSMSIHSVDLEKIITEQINRFLKVTQALKVSMHHIKLHGALYNDVFREKNSTLWFLNYAFAKYKGVKIFVPISAVNFVKEVNQDWIIYEAFADRNYTDDLQLVSRSKLNASIEKADEVLTHTKQLFLENKLISENGNKYIVKADTFCLHGDNSNVLAIAKKIYNLKK